MPLRIEDVSSLPGRGVVDQIGEDIGEIKDVYGIGDDGDPMWVSIEIAPPETEPDAEEKLRFLPLARVRDDGKEKLSVPYSIEHIESSPEVEAEDDEISEDDDNKLRVYYAVGLADEEFRTESNSYASQVPEGEAPAKKITDDLDDKETPGGESRDRSTEERHEEYSPAENEDEQHSGAEKQAKEGS